VGFPSAHLGLEALAPSVQYTPSTGHL
jgi:hypothetical protein